MTPRQRIARAERAEQAWDEFIAPLFVGMRAEYLTRITEHAATELAVAARTDKITVLSQALRVLDNLETGIREAIRDGEIATREKLRAEKVELMTDAQQRLLRIGIV